MAVKGHGGRKRLRWQWAVVSNQGGVGFSGKAQGACNDRVQKGADWGWTVVVMGVWVGKRSFGWSRMEQQISQAKKQGMGTMKGEEDVWRLMARIGVAKSGNARSWEREARRVKMFRPLHRKGETGCLKSLDE